MSAPTFLVPLSNYPNYSAVDLQNNLQLDLCYTNVISLQITLFEFLFAFKYRKPINVTKHFGSKIKEQ